MVVAVTEVILPTAGGQSLGCWSCFIFISSGIFSRTVRVVVAVAAVLVVLLLVVVL